MITYRKSQLKKLEKRGNWCIKKGAAIMAAASRCCYGQPKQKIFLFCMQSDILTVNRKFLLDNLFFLIIANISQPWVQENEHLGGLFGRLWSGSRKWIMYTLCVCLACVHVDKICVKKKKCSSHIHIN